ncbi:hypothetical protein V8E54_008043 [Elaphomyces granulatus]
MSVNEFARAEDLRGASVDFRTFRLSSFAKDPTLQPDVYLCCMGKTGNALKNHWLPLKRIVVRCGGHKAQLFLSLRQSILNIMMKNRMFGNRLKDLGGAMTLKISLKLAEEISDRLLDEPEDVEKYFRREHLEAALQVGQEGNSQDSSFWKVNLSQSFPEDRAPFIIHTRKMRNAFTTSDQKDKAGWDGRSEQQNDDQEKGKLFLYQRRSKMPEELSPSSCEQRPMPNKRHSCRLMLAAEI